MKTTLFVEYGQNQTEDKALIAKVKEIWVNAGNKIKDINTLNLYVKPEENSVYYVVNETVSGKLTLPELEEA
ncbi:hypothetical protein HNP82_002164 [Catenibacillus scindens]|uniref:Uncharacterized protein n=1 Tax=Catenibacillus scindens TaxID=673271 RepID=A0A7W8HC66_9FIRM|nr:DUF6465 family protein [Catenibacillus scindens]MBB5265025.1 hypothetical protein [Catenibacillus scindens]